MGTLFIDIVLGQGCQYRCLKTNINITILSKIATNKKIVITRLWHAMGPQTMYYLIATDKVAEQHISRK